MAMTDNTNLNPDLSDVRSGSSSAKAPPPTRGGGTADFSDVSGGGSSTARTAGGMTYTVRSGDSLSKIARQFYGDAAQWKRIHAANRDAIPEPDLIHPGLQLTIPDA